MLLRVVVTYQTNRWNRGGFFLISLRNGTGEVIDGREVAPGSATEDMFHGNPQLSREGGLAIAIPLVYLLYSPPLRLRQ